MPLIAGLGVRNAVAELTHHDEIQLKWPNDVVHAHRKLGGLLLQMRSEAGGPAYVVAGLGLNLKRVTTPLWSEMSQPLRSTIAELSIVSPFEKM